MGPYWDIIRGRAISSVVARSARVIRMDWLDAASITDEGMRQMLSGEWYLDNATLRAARRRCAELVHRFNLLGPDAEDDRAALLARLFGHIGADCEVAATFRCSYGAHICLGDRVFVNSDAIFMDDAPIRIDDDVRIGPRVQLLTAQHPLEDHEKRRDGWERALGIRIRRNAWLGGGVIVLAGVTIGKNSVVGAGSVVSKDVPDNTLVAGVPAKPIRTL